MCPVRLIAIGSRRALAFAGRAVGRGAGLARFALSWFAAIAAVMSVFACFSVASGWETAAAGVIGFIEAVAFKDNPRRKEDTADMISTFGTHCQRLIGHFLPRLEAVATGLTKILVRWHTPITSCKKKISYKSL